MTRLELFAMLNCHLNTLRDKKFEYPKDFETYRDFVRCHPARDFDYKTVDSNLFWEYSKYVLHSTFSLDENSSKHNLSFEEISSLIDSFSTALNTMSNEEYGSLAHFFTSLCNYKYLYNDIYAYFDCPSFEDGELLKKIESSDLSRYSDLIKKLKEGFSKHNCRFCSIFDLFFVDKKMDPSIKYVLEVYSMFKYHDSVVEDSNVMGSARCRRNVLRASFTVSKSHASYKKIYDVISKISNYVCSVENDINKERTSNEREINLLEKAIELLDSELKNDEIKETRKIAKLIVDPQIRFEVLSFIKKHNEAYRDRLNNKLSILTSNDISNYNLLFLEYGYQITVPDYIIEKYSIDEARYALDILSKISKSIFNSNNICIILNSTNLDRINSIFYLCDKGYLTSSIISEYNYSFFDINNGIYDIFTRNIELLNKYGINPCIICNSDFFRHLTDDNNNFIKNIEILYSYDLLKGLKNTISYSFLISDNLESKIDSIIEAGCYEFLCNNLDVLNYDYTKRLYLEKAIGTTVMDQEMFDITLSRSSFVVDDNLIDDYIYNAVSVNKEYSLDINLGDLNIYKVNDIFYSFNGVIVSVNKVKRLYDLGNSLYSSIFSGLVLTDLEYESIIKCLNPIGYQRNSTFTK